MKIALVTLVLATGSVVWARHVPVFEINDDVSSKIINGHDAYPGQFPYMVAIMLTSSNGLKCGGAIIRDQWYVTTITCVNMGAFYFYTYLGLHDMYDLENGGMPEKHSVGAFYRYPNYDGGAQNDITLMRMDSVINPDNPYIKTIPIAPDNGDDYVGADCTTMGWGARSVGGYPGGILQYTSTNVITNEECAALTGYDVTTIVCAQEGSSGPCLEDRGGPLVCKRNEVTYLVGILHKVAEPCDETAPAAYTRISLYNEWIESVIDRNP